MPARIACVKAGCCRMRANSSSVSFAGLSRIVFGMPSLPMSCSRPARCSSRSSAGREAELVGDRARVGRDAARVAGREGRLRVDHVRERLADAVEAGVVEHEHAIGGLEREHLRRDVVAREVAPESVIRRDREDDVRELRIEPAAAPLAHHLVRGRDAVGGEEHLGGLAQACDAREQRDLLAAQPERLPAAVPVLVERAHGFGARLGEVEAADDRGAAVAARLDDLLALRDERPQHRERALRARDATARHVLRRVAHDLRGLRPVHELAVRLESDVVAAEELAHACGRRRAADVLQQQRVVERVALLGAELQLPRDAHADQAAALGLAHGMALGHVERVRERCDHLGLP